MVLVSLALLCRRWLLFYAGGFCLAQHFDGTKHVDENDNDLFGCVAGHCQEQGKV
jgi:hypothetical protein